MPDKCYLQNLNTCSTFLRCKGVKELASLQKRAIKSLEFHGKIPGFPRFFAHKEKPGVSWLSTLSRKSQKAWKAKRLRTFRAFQDSTVSWKARNVTPKSLGKPGKPGRNAPRVLCFPLCAKKRGKPGMIASFPGFRGFLESMGYQPEKPGKAWKARNKYSTLSWLFPMYKKARKARNDSQLSGLSRTPQFLGKHGIPTRE